jgi:hypothetical protein
MPSVFSLLSVCITSVITMLNVRASFIPMRCLQLKLQVVVVPNVPMTVAARSKAWTVFARSNTGIVSSNPIQGMDVYVFVLFCLATGWSPLQGVLPTVYKLRNWKKKRPRSTMAVEPWIVVPNFMTLIVYWDANCIKGRKVRKEEDRLYWADSSYKMFTIITTKTDYFLLRFGLILSSSTRRCLDW